MRWEAADTALRREAAMHGIGGQPEAVAEPAPELASAVGFSARDFPELVNRPPVPADENY